MSLPAPLNGREAIPVTLATMRRARNATRGMFAPGLDREDLQQEALIGALKARRTYDGSSPFLAFEWLCMRRAVISAARSATGPERGGGTWMEDLPEDVAAMHTTEHLAEVRAELRAIAARALLLSPIERRAIEGVANGLTYQEIGGPFKQIDNAVQRARRKLAG